MPPLIVGAVNVLLVNMSVVALPTRVSVEVGSVRVPVLVIDEITGVIIVGELARTIAPLPVWLPNVMLSALNPPSAEVFKLNV